MSHILLKLARFDQHLVHSGGLNCVDVHRMEVSFEILKILGFSRIDLNNILCRVPITQIWAGVRGPPIHEQSRPLPWSSPPLQWPSR